MGGQDKLAASIAGRPVLRWAVEALRGGAGGRRRHRRDHARARRRPARQRLAARPRARVVVGGARRQDSVAAGRAGRERGHRARPRRRPAVRLAGGSSAASSTAPSATARPSRCCPSSMPSSGSRASRITGAADRDRALPRPDAAGRPPRPAARPPAERHAGGPDEIRRRGRAAGSRWRRGRTPWQGEAGNIKVTLPEDLDAGAPAGRRATPARAVGPRHGQPPLRSRRRPSPRGPAHRGRAAAARPLRRRRRPPRPLRRTPGGCRTWATWVASSRPASRPRGASTAGARSPRCWRRLDGAGLGRRQHGRHRSWAPGHAWAADALDAMARLDRGARRTLARAASRSRRRPATWRATRAPGGPSAPTCLVSVVPR